MYFLLCAYDCRRQGFVSRFLPLELNRMHDDRRRSQKRVRRVETVSPDIAKEAGIAAFLMKPLAKEELAGAVRRALDRDL